MSNLQTSPSGPFHTLVVLGESNVQGGGWLAREDERWPDVLTRLLTEAQETTLHYVNAGLGASVIAPTSPGYEASAKPSAAERLDEAVLAHHPDLLVIAYGMNDMRAGMSVDAFRVELLSLLRRVRQVGNPLVVLVNPYYMTAYHHFPPYNRGSLNVHTQYNHMLKELAQEECCVYADAYNAVKGCDHAVHPDTVHMNKLGCLLVAHAVFAAIVKAAPGIADSINQRDAGTEWTQFIRDWQNAGREPSDQSRPGEK